MTEQAAPAAEAAPAVEPIAEGGTAPVVTPAPAAEPVKAEEVKPVTDWVKESRKWEDRAKENGEDSKRWKEYIEKVKPEQDKVAAQLTETLAELAQLKRDILKNQVAQSVGLPAEAISRLQGETEEELKADAANLLALFGGAPSFNRPKPTPQGHISESAQSIKANDASEYEALLRTKFK